MVVGATTVLEEAMVYLPFGTMSMVRIFEEDGGKARGFFGSMKSLKALKKFKCDFRLKMDSQVT